MTTTHALAAITAWPSLWRPHDQTGWAECSLVLALPRQALKGFHFEPPFLRRMVGRAIPIVREVFRWARLAYSKTLQMLFSTRTDVFGMSATQSDVRSIE
jgi:hypothetical protein